MRGSRTASGKCHAGRARRGCASAAAGGDGLAERNAPIQYCCDVCGVCPIVGARSAPYTRGDDVTEVLAGLKVTASDAKAVEAYGGAAETAATIFVDDSAIGAIVGQGGAGVRGMEEEFGLKIKVKGGAELPRGTNKIGSSAPEWDMQAERSKGGRSWAHGGGGRRGKRGKRRR